MSTYRLPPQYRRRYVRRSGRRYRRGTRWTPGQILLAIVAGVVALGAVGTTTPAGPAAVGVIEQVTGIGAHSGHQAAEAIAFAKAQTGHCPYTWGGTGPCSAGFDCSGLMMTAYAQAGVTIPRVADQQWFGLHHIKPGHQQPGDLVFFPGSDGTMADPGHVGMVLTKHLMVDAYDQAAGIRVEPYGPTASPASGMQAVIGFARPVPLARSPRPPPVQVPAGGYTQDSWARAFLAGGGYTATSCNLVAVRAWMAAEGGHWANTASFNPLNDTLTEPGSRSVNSKHVQAYTSWGEGLQATLTTLTGPDYGHIRAALKAGNNAQAVADAVAASVWGTKPFTTGSC